MPVALAACMLAFLLQTTAPRQAPPSLRFHHVHVRVGDPASSSRDASVRLNGTRTILQGHGLSVRAGREYVVFERDDEAAPSSDSRLIRSASPGDVFQQAVKWTTERGLTVEPSDFRGVNIQDAIPAGRIDTIAFSSTDPKSAIDLLAKQGVRPIEQRDDVARFRLSRDLTLEIMGETDRPDTHWCPMHPDIRAPAAAKCSVCGMDLVPIPPPRIGEYRLDVVATPGVGGRGIASLRIRVIDPATNGAVTRFFDVHERRLHLFIVSRNLDYFAHVHPEQQSDGSFSIDQDLPEGEYMLIGDFLPEGGTPQMVQRALVTPHYTGRLFAAVSPDVTAREQTVDGLRVRLQADSLRPLRASALRFVVTDASTGAPIVDLEPYLGAPGHLLIVDADLRSAIHGHPERQSSGPEVAFDPVLPTAGRYKLWVQFQRKGRVVTVPFVIDVPES